MKKGIYGRWGCGGIQENYHVFLGLSSMISVLSEVRDSI
jgi:hypothetical protein